MRSLRERLAALQPSTPRAQRPAPVGVPIDAVERGRYLAGSVGEVFVVEQAREDHDLRALLEHAPLTPSLFVPDAPAVQPEEVVFLDTETTGLAGGTGTQVFLVGLGRFEDDRLVVRQFFLRGPGEERALLDALGEALGPARLLVTFNGRTFDWPLIEGRFILHGYRPRFTFAHLDILPPARRVWRHRLQTCTLGNLEANLFGVVRGEDVPGWLIPQLYFDYLRDGDARRLRPVFVHNREDVATLVRLTNLLVRAAAAPRAVLDHPADRAGLALLLLHRGELMTGIDLLADALEEADLLPPDLRRRAEVELSRWLKRLDRTPEAVPLWCRMCDRAARHEPLDLYPFEELAKYYEHQARDLVAAEQVVERALRLLDLRGEYHGRRSLLHRLERIRRKQAAARVRGRRRGAGPDDRPTSERHTIEWRV
ncbi:MAG: ribonuclease H-like domain-containing protein [Sphaerobacter sp.]|nr:ribonuclease H-like domain-containing protein [Sphaerobacter sp.]